MGRNFWSQYLAPNYPVPFIDQLKQLVELHQAAELAMKDFVVRLWPVEPIPSSLPRTREVDCGRLSLA